MEMLVAHNQCGVTLGRAKLAYPRFSIRSRQFCRLRTRR